MANNFVCFSHAQICHITQCQWNQSEVFVQQFQLNRVDLIERWSELKRLTYIVDTQVPFNGPQMVESDDGEFTVASSSTSPQLDQLRELLYEGQVVSPEHLPRSDYQAEPSIDLSNLTVSELKQFLTWVFRTDRFVEGLFVAFVNAQAISRAIRRLYLLEVCDETGWPRAFQPLTAKTVPEGIELRSINGEIEGRTSGSRHKCTATGCPGWFIGVLWETGQQMYICSEGWHYDPNANRIDVIGGGEISARFISPKPLGTPPLDREQWPHRSALANRKG